MMLFTTSNETLSVARDQSSVGGSEEMFMRKAAGSCRSAAAWEQPARRASMMIKKYLGFIG